MAQGQALAEAAVELATLREWAELAERKEEADASVQQAQAAAEAVQHEVEGELARLEGQLAELDAQLGQGQAAGEAARARPMSCMLQLMLSGRPP